MVLNLDLKHRKENNMTQEEKELLLVDLCARLPYNIIMNGKITNNIGHDNVDFVLEPSLLAAAIACGCKPYLRPISSMTDEEKHKLYNIRPYFVNSDDIVIGTHTSI